MWLAGYVAERIAAVEEAGMSHLQVVPVPTGDPTAVGVIAEVKEMVS